MKHLIIFGPQCSGKSFLAKNIAKAFDNFLYIQARHLRIDNIFYLSELNDKTELLILDDMTMDNFLLGIDLMRNKYVKVEKQCRPPEIVSVPPVIITIDIDVFTLKEYLQTPASYQWCRFIRTDLKIIDGRPIFSSERIFFK